MKVLAGTPDASLSFSGASQKPLPLPNVLDQDADAPGGQLLLTGIDELPDAEMELLDGVAKAKAVLLAEAEAHGVGVAVAPAAPEKLRASSTPSSRSSASKAE